ncbi:unnamed protein product [Leptosia nina]|uniref:Uncharacterized protein n=1 Tax=Leptosia nina TaxID=320188 RepID=A0AAV1J5N1_9NEOP
MMSAAPYVAFGTSPHSDTATLDAGGPLQFKPSSDQIGSKSMSRVLVTWMVTYGVKRATATVPLEGDWPTGGDSLSQ